MRDFRSVLNIIGLLLCIEALAMLIPMMVDLLYQKPDWQKFFFSSVIKSIKIFKNKPEEN